MSWPFWSFRTSSPAPSLPELPPDCQSIEPLLPLYADHMASPDEVRLVETHLPGCTGCREALFWMQATHRALAARPVAVPPASLHLRIAEAIAASSAAPSLRPARSFILRPAYVAAASLTVVGVLLGGHSLLHSPASTGPSVRMTKPVPPLIASAPLKAKNVLPHPARVKPRQASVARNVPSDTTKPDTERLLGGERALAVKKTAPQNQIASSTPVPAPIYTPAPLHTPTKSTTHPPAAPHDKMASTKVPPAEKRYSTAVDTAAPKTPSAPLLAHAVKEPPPVAVVVAPSTVTTQPAVQTASAAAPSGNLLAGVNAYARAMHTVALGKTSFVERQISRGGTDAMHGLDTEHSGYQPAVYTP